MTYGAAVASPRCAPSRAAGCLIELYQADSILAPLGRAQQQQQQQQQPQQQPQQQRRRQRQRQRQQQHPPSGEGPSAAQPMDVDPNTTTGAARCKEGGGGEAAAAEAGDGGPTGRGTTQRLGAEAHALPLPLHAVPPLPSRPPHRALHPLFLQHQQQQLQRAHAQQLLDLGQQQQQQQQQQPGGQYTERLAKLHATWHQACTQGSPQPPLPAPSPSSPLRAPSLQDEHQQQLPAQPPAAAAQPVPLLVVDLGRRGNVGRWLGQPQPGQPPNLVPQVSVLPGKPTNRQAG